MLPIAAEDDVDAAVEAAALFRVVRSHIAASSLGIEFQNRSQMRMFCTQVVVDSASTGRGKQLVGAGRPDTVGAARDDDVPGIGSCCHGTVQGDFVCSAQ